MSKQTVSVVTGGSGFIGSHLCELLLDRGEKVFCIDNLLTGIEENVRKLQNKSGFEFIRSDVTAQFPVFEKIDRIYHLASPASVIDYQRFPEETALVNSVGTRNLLTVAKAYKARFFYASTSEVYGDPLQHPQKESYWGNVNPNGVRSCYDEAKRFGEMMTLLYFRKYAVNARIARIFNTYGPRMRATDGRVVSNFVTQALAGQPLTVHGDGMQTRSFCYVSDLVRGIIALMDSDSVGGEVVNLGNPQEYKTIDLAKLVIVLTKSKSAIVYDQLPQDDPRQRRPDITKAQKLLGWQPAVGLEEGLEKTIEYYRT